MTTRTYTEDDIRNAFALGYMQSSEGDNGKCNSHGEWGRNVNAYLATDSFVAMAAPVLENRFGIKDAS